MKMRMSALVKKSGVNIGTDFSNILHEMTDKV